MEKMDHTQKEEKLEVKYEKIKMGVINENWN